MLEILKQILMLMVLTSPVWLFLSICLYDYIRININNIRVYKKYYNQLDNMIFYKDKDTIFGFTDERDYGISYFENNWYLFLKSSVLDFEDIRYGVNPFKNYWYNKMVKKISAKTIYSSSDYHNNREKIYKIEQRNLLLDKILKSC
jgi:hypothetical protein